MELMLERIEQRAGAQTHLYPLDLTLVEEPDQEEIDDILLSGGVFGEDLDLATAVSGIFDVFCQKAFECMDVSAVDGFGLSTADRRPLSR